MSGPIGPSGPTGALAAGQPQVLERSSESTAELSRLRHSELKTISNRLGRMCRHGLDRVRILEGLASLFWGAAIASAAGWLPLRAANPAHQAKVDYVWVLAALVVFAVVFTVFRAVVKAERTESIKAIKDDLDEILTSYPMPAKDGI